MNPKVLNDSAAQPRYVSWYCGVQAFLALDFVLLLPLGPDVAHSMGFSAGHLGWLSGAYSFGAFVGGLACVARLDRWPRKHALLAALLLLSVLALLQGVVTHLSQLVSVRFVQGLVSAPAAALLLAAVIDQTAPSHRGRVIGTVMLGFTLAMVLGIPLGLWGAQHIGWRYLIVSLALAQGVWCGLGYWLVAISPTAPHAASSVKLVPQLIALCQQPLLRRALLAQGSNTLACFLIVPSFSAFFLSNLAWPRDHLAPLYLLGGLATFFALKGWGRWCDAKSPHIAFNGALALSLCGLLPLLMPGAGLGPLPSPALLALCFCAFMAANACRQLSLTAYTSELPQPYQRGAYLSLEHAVQDGAAAAGAIIASAVFWLLPPSAQTQAAGLDFEPWAMVGLVCIALTAMVAALCFQRPLQNSPEPRFLQP
jgi:predicted MFS family arabinose efflux permease